MVRNNPNECLKVNLNNKHKLNISMSKNNTNNIKKDANLDSEINQDNSSQSNDMFNNVARMEEYATYIRLICNQSSISDQINPNKLRVIITARTVEEINLGAKIGYFPLITEVGDLSMFTTRCMFNQDLKTGEITYPTGDLRLLGLGADKEKKTETYRFLMPRKYEYEIPFAAYLIPRDLEIGEHVFLDDIIEDYIGSEWNQGDKYRLDFGDAIWTGEKFEIIENEPSVIYG